jgi:hypothetical protein
MQVHMRVPTAQHLPPFDHLHAHDNPRSSHMQESIDPIPGGVPAFVNADLL